MACGILLSCPYCGNTEGMIDAKGRPRKFCSRECSHKVTLEARPSCPICGAKMHHGRVHCSRKCSIIGTTFRLKVPCYQCGTPVVASYSTTRNGEKSDKKFCSRACYDAFRKDIRDQRRIDCPRCGKSFIPECGHKFCSETCWLAEKKAKPKNCVNCGCLFTPVKPMIRKTGVKWISHNGGKTCGPECRLAWYSNDEERKKKISAAFTGDKHPAWKGGRTWRSNASHRGPNWKSVAEKARKRDGYKCRECGMTQDEHIDRFGNALNVHHIEPFHNFPNSKQANRLSNLITLCRPHHTIAEAVVPAVQMTLPLADNRSGLRPGMARGERHYAAKLTRDQVVEIRTTLKDVSLKELSERFGVGKTVIHAARIRKSWKSVP